MGNPTLVVLTDRNDLDDQLFGSLRAQRRAAAPGARAGATTAQHLRELLAGRLRRHRLHDDPEVRARGEGRRATRCSPTGATSIVIADEAHRSQYDFVDGFARHLRDALPNATFIGFTGTPIELDDRDTRSVFGDYIDVYDIQRAVEDGATVPIYYESRLAQARPEAGGAAEARRGVRGGDRGRGGAAAREAEVEVGAARGRRRRREAARADRRRPRRALRAAARGDGRQGDDRLHEPADLRRPVRRDRRAAARVARRRRRRGRDQGRHDRLGDRTRPSGSRTSARKARREALAKRVQGSRRPARARDRARHVADRLRRAVPAHDVRRQADARARADAGDRARQPRLPRQAGRAGRRLPRPRRRPAQGARDLHRERRSRDGRRSTRSEAVARDAREARGLPRHLPRLRLRRASTTPGEA